MQSEYCEYKIVDEVLHIIYKKDIPNYINKIADSYEGKMPDRIGINFPINILGKEFKDFKDNKIFEYKDKVKYVIVYKKGDIITKKHELLHSKFYIDKEYNKKIKSMWNDMNSLSKKKVIQMLKKMGYPEKEEILIDEFQAYYYTEKSNFFGKI
jgi:hypothetical protein